MASTSISTSHSGFTDQIMAAIVSTGCASMWYFLRASIASFQFLYRLRWRVCERDPYAQPRPARAPLWWLQSFGSFVHERPQCQLFFRFCQRVRFHQQRWMIQRAPPCWIQLFPQLDCRLISMSDYLSLLPVSCFGRKRRCCGDCRSTNYPHQFCFHRQNAGDHFNLVVFATLLCQLFPSRRAVVFELVHTIASHRPRPKRQAHSAVHLFDRNNTVPAPHIILITLPRTPSIEFWRGYHSSRQNF